MIRAIRSAPLLLLAAVFTADAAAPATTARPFSRPEADELNYLFLASDRPVLIRLHLRAAGDKPFAAVWEGYMGKLFAWFDADKNGSLDKTEAGRIPSPQGLTNLSFGGFAQGDGRPTPLEAIDKDKDGKVSQAEFNDYYRATSQPVRFSFNPQLAASAKTTNEAIYRRLGRAGNGRLTKADVAKLSGLMAKLDEDEDEYLTAAELDTDNDGGGLYAEAAIALRPGMNQGPSDPSIVELNKATQAAGLVAQVMQKYDKDKDGRLTPGKDGIDKEFVAALDRDRDGSADTREVEAYFYGKPDVVLRARVGPRSAGLAAMVEKTGWFASKPRTEVLNAAKLPPGLSKKVKQTDGDNLSLELGDARVAMQAVEGSTTGLLEGAKSFFLTQFDAKADKDGYVTKPKDNTPNDFVGGVFTQADRNGDGKMHRSEFVGWLDLMNEGTVAYVGVSVTDRGRSLFELLDVDQDNKLSIREARDAWSRLAVLAKPEGLAQDDVPRSLRFVFSQGPAVSINRFGFFGMGSQPARVDRAKSVPDWFSKMDLNNDGELSPREWLGSREAFDEIDADKDGLVSPQEARAFEARKNGPKK